MTNLERWQPIEHLEKVLYVESVLDDKNGLEILLKGLDVDGPTLLIKFENFLGYRNFNESQRLSTLNSFPELTEKWSLFKTVDSSLIDWLIEESSHTLNQEGLIHYIIATPEDILEVVGYSSPLVLWRS